MQRISPTLLRKGISQLKILLILKAIVIRFFFYLMNNLFYTFIYSILYFTMKSVQGDSGHARMDMVADVYSHIIDEDRRFNAQKFEEQFYNAKGLRGVEEGKTAPMPKFDSAIEMLDPMAVSEEAKENVVEKAEDDNAALLAKLLANPETAALIKALAKAM